MDYEALLAESDTAGLVVKEKPLRYNDGRINGNKIAIRRDIETSTEKEGTIINQNISEGTEIAKGENITLTVATSKKVTTTSNKKTSSSSSNSYRPSSTNRPSNTQQNPGGSNQQSGNTNTCDRSKTITIVKQSSLNGDSAAATLKNYQNAYPGIKFTYTEKASQKGSPGMIHQDMPKSFTANYCDTYTLIIIK